MKEPGSYDPGSSAFAVPGDPKAPHAVLTASHSVGTQKPGPLLRTALEVAYDGFG